jgi:anti-anti-sigma regulatory factor
MKDQTLDFLPIQLALDAAPYGFGVVEVHPGPRFKGLYTNASGAMQIGKDATFGRGIFLDELLPEAFYQPLFDHYNECLNKRQTLHYVDYVQFPGIELWMNVIMSPVFNQAGEIQWILTTTFDITAERRQQEAERAEREAVIEHQAAIVPDLSTPLLAISDRVVVMPIVGTIDSRRTQLIMETLLTGIGETQADIAILDITGVAVVDTAVANALIQAAQAVRLLGARVVLTGIRPEVAQTLVSLGTNLEGIVTRSTLRSGIAYSMEAGV